jgi:hypothetical protein
VVWQAYYASFMPDNMREELMEVARSNNFVVKYDKFDWNLHLTKACSEASRQPQRLITNHSPAGRGAPQGDPSPTTLGANQVFTPSLHEVQGHTNISDRVYNQVWGVGESVLLLRRAAAKPLCLQSFQLLILYLLWIEQQQQQQHARGQPQQGQRINGPGQPQGYDDGQRNAYRVPAQGQPGQPQQRGRVPGLQDDGNQQMDGFMC